MRSIVSCSRTNRALHFAVRSYDHNRRLRSPLESGVFSYFDYSGVETEYNLISSIGKEYGDMPGEDAKREYRDKMYIAGIQDAI